MQRKITRFARPGKCGFFAASGLASAAGELILEREAKAEVPANRAVLYAFSIPETGKYSIVDYLCYADVGTVINPRALGGQILGRSMLGIGHAIGVQNHFGVHVAGGSADRLNQRGLAAQEALLVRVEHSHQRDLG